MATDETQFYVGHRCLVI